MGNAVAVIVGIFCAVLMCIGLIPLLGWLNWIVLPGCVFGIIVGALSKEKSGLTINAAVAIVAIVRLVLGGGVF